MRAPPPYRLVGRGVTSRWKEAANTQYSEQSMGEPSLLEDEFVVNGRLDAMQLLRVSRDFRLKGYRIDERFIQQ